MFFDAELSGRIDKYGVALLTGKGKFHFAAYAADQNQILLMCRSGYVGGTSLSVVKSIWFEDEADAAVRFRQNRHACQKCLRAMETIQFEKERDRNFA